MCQATPELLEVAAALPSLPLWFGEASWLQGVAGVHQKQQEWSVLYEHHSSLNSWLEQKFRMFVLQIYRYRCRCWLSNAKEFTKALFLQELVPSSVKPSSLPHPRSEP